MSRLGDVLVELGPVAQDYMVSPGLSSDMRWVRADDINGLRDELIELRRDAGPLAKPDVIRAYERERVLHEICKIAGNMEQLRELAESAGSDDQPVSLARARSLLRELAAVGGPLDPDPATSS